MRFAEGAVTKRQWPGCLACGNSNTGRGVCVCVLCAVCVYAPARRPDLPSRVVWCGGVRCGAVRCGAVRCGAVRCGAVRVGWGGVGCGAVRWGGCGGVWVRVRVGWGGVGWGGVGWGGVGWGVVRCGAVWCCVVCPRRCYRSNGQDGLAHGKIHAGWAVCPSACCVSCVTRVGR